VRVFLTGATGFVMGAVATRLRERGDDVVALVRSRTRAAELTRLGCELFEGDVTALDRAGVDVLRSCDALIHGAAIYEIGVNAERRREMETTNVSGTRRMLQSAREANVKRIVYVSTIAAFGNTRGQSVAEGYVPTLPPTSAYEDTKRRAHEIALEASRDGLPIVIVQPGQVYGPNDHSEIGANLGALARGGLRYLALGGVGLNFVHVEDAADGIVRALDHGRLGETYVLGGEIGTLADAYREVAEVTGHSLPRVVIPDSLLRLVGRLVPRMREVIASADGVTFWASDAKARAELGTTPRGLREGMSDTYGAQKSRHGSTRRST
jgi:nucleoside-diphosphate-sugar epimerase